MNRKSSPWALPVPLIIGFSAVMLALASAPGAAAQRYSGWSTPMPFDEVNSTSDLEFASAISKDGLSFYFQRGNALVSGEDIWIAHRERKEAPWGSPEKLPDT